MLKLIEVIYSTFGVGWGWCGEVEIKAISASNWVEVEVEAELGKSVRIVNSLCYFGSEPEH